MVINFRDARQKLANATQSQGPRVARPDRIYLNQKDFSQNANVERMWGIYVYV
jgi:hypothetical protein